MRYRLLGTLAVERDDAVEVSIAPPKQRALLAFLLLQRGRPVSRERVIDALWGDDAPPAATESLFAIVSRLRSSLGHSAIESVPGGYRIDVGEGELDVLAFEADVARGRHAARAAHWAAAEAALGGALERWRGAALADFDGETFVHAEATSLEELRLAALEERIQARIELGAAAELIPELEGLVIAHRVRERLWEQLMLVLYRAGRQADALERYRELRRALRDELGLDPSPRTRELQHQILRQDPALGGPSTAAGTDQGRLPPILSTFVGRAGEVQDALEILGGHRLLTLTGPGGVGKTRLAIAVAESTLAHRPDEVQFVDLSAIRDPARVVERIGSVVGGGSRPDEAIGMRRILIVLDNFEQVLDAAPAIAELLVRCPNLRFLVTSRAPLRIIAERQLDVPPLDIADAAELFVDRAHAATAEVLQREDLRAVIARLDGLPLALELAAARVKSISLGAMRGLLDDRGAFLASGPRDAPDRHRTLHATIEWSYTLLAPRSQAVFRRLAVAAPGFDLEAAIAITDAGVDEIGELVDHSLIRRTGDRYTMLETIREFADEHLHDEERREARARHMRHFAALAFDARVAADALGSQGANSARLNEWLDVCVANHDNLRLAYDHAIGLGDSDAIVTLFRGTAMHWANLGLSDEAVGWARLAVEAARDRPHDVLEDVRNLASNYARYVTDFQWTIELLEPVLEAATERGDLVQMATTLDELGGTYAQLGQFDEAWRLYALAHETHRREAICEPRHLCHTLGFEILTMFQQARFAEADAKAREMRSAHDAAPRNRIRTIEAELYIAQAAVFAGHPEDARPGFEIAVAESVAGGYRHYLADPLEQLAGLDRRSRPEHAARLIGMADRVRAEMQEPVFFAEWRAALVDELRAALGPGAFDTIRLTGMAIPVHEMAAAALAREDHEV